MITIISSLDYAVQAVLLHQCVFVFVGGFKAQGEKKKTYIYI